MSTLIKVVSSCLMKKYLLGNSFRYAATKANDDRKSVNFETVFSLPFIKYFALFNRIKVYHLVGSAVAVPSCGILELADIVATNTFLTTVYFSVTAAAVFSISSLPFTNIIGFIYVSDDDKLIKISTTDFWGRRKEKIIPTEDWIPLLELPAKTKDAFYLSPMLTDGTSYKLLIKFGIIQNPKKMGRVLE